MPSQCDGSLSLIAVYSQTTHWFMAAGMQSWGLIQSSFYSWCTISIHMSPLLLDWVCIREALARGTVDICIKDLCGLNFLIFFSFTVDLFLAIPVYVLYISDCICSVYMALRKTSFSWWDLHIKIKFYLSSYLYWASTVWGYAASWQVEVDLSSNAFLNCIILASKFTLSQCHLKVAR